jgi:hypothetical protein
MQVGRSYFRKGNLIMGRDLQLVRMPYTGSHPSRNLVPYVNSERRVPTITTETLKRKALNRHITDNIAGLLQSFRPPIQITDGRNHDL